LAESLEIAAGGAGARNAASGNRRSSIVMMPRRLRRKQGLKQKLAPSKWASSERIDGEHRRN